MTVALRQPAMKPARHRPHRVARILVLVLLIVLVEGGLRKWLIPGTTLVWMAMRDCLVAYGIAAGIGNGWLRLNAWQEGLFVAWSMLVSLWASVQVVAEEQVLLVAIIGLRSWLFYMWFAWLCARTMTRADVEWVLKVVALTVVPLATLALIQHLLPPSHILNKQGEGGEVKDIFVAGKSVRTTATFSFTSGFVAYLLFVAPIALSALTGQLSLRPAILRWLVFIAWAVSVLVAGARQSIITAVVMLGGLTIAMVIRRQTRGSGGNSIFGLILLGVTVASLPYVVPTAIEANRYRFESASKFESVGERIVNMAVGSEETWQWLPFLGKGIGLGNNAAGAVSGGTRGFLLAENETERTLLEAGLLGLAFLIAKMLVVAIGLIRSFSRLRATGDIVPWLLWLCMGLQIPAPMLGQLTAHAFAWLTLALAWASLNPDRRVVAAVAAPTQPLYRPGHARWRPPSRSPGPRPG